MLFHRIINSFWLIYRHEILNKGFWEGLTLYVSILSPAKDILLYFNFRVLYFITIDIIINVFNLIICSDLFYFIMVY